MTLSIIVAYAANGVIGRKNDLPWYLPADLKRFKQLTTGHTVIMGRRTYESIIARLGHALPDRQNIVLTRSANFTSSDVVVAAGSLAEAISKTNQEDEVFVIGGSAVFEAALPLAQRIYATEVKATVPGDVYFPTFKKAQWKEVTRESHVADEKNQFDFDFVIYERPA